MSWYCAVRVIDEKGQPKQGARVTLFVFGLMGGHISKPTDEDGWAEFDLDVGSPEQTIESVFIDGELVGQPGLVRDGQAMSFTT